MGGGALCCRLGSGTPWEREPGRRSGSRRGTAPLLGGVGGAAKGNALRQSVRMPLGAQRAGHFQHRLRAARSLFLI